MAVTFKSTIPVVPGPRKTGPRVLKLPELAAQTFPPGAILSKAAGMIRMHTTGVISAGFYGVGLNSGQNGATDRAKTSPFYRIERDQPYKAAVSGSLASSQLGATAAISQNTAGQVFLLTAATASDSSAARIVEFAEGAAPGDTNPVVLFTFIGSTIQEG
jgi:hypothetical protein